MDQMQYKNVGIIESDSERIPRLKDGGQAGPRLAAGSINLTIEAARQSAAKNLHRVWKTFPMWASMLRPGAAV